MSYPVTEFSDALEAMDRVAADTLFQQCLQRGSPIQVVEQLVVPALQHMGRAWDEGSVALSQVYMSGRFCEEMVERVLPPSDPDRKHQPRSAIVVLNDHHLLGKRIVYAQMRASGFELFDYGRMDVPTLVARVQADRVRVLLVSVLMLASALQVGELRRALDAAGADVKIVVGGAPFNFDPALWQEVGAHAMGRTASDAARVVQAWMEQMP